MWPVSPEGDPVSRGTDLATTPKLSCNELLDSKAIILAQKCSIENAYIFSNVIRIQVPAVFLFSLEYPPAALTSALGLYPIWTSDDEAEYAAFRFTRLSGRSSRIRRIISRPAFWYHWFWFWRSSHNGVILLPSLSPRLMFSCNSALFYIHT